MPHIALYQPEIPPNTGNIIRLCANTGSTLHLIHPLGFEWDDKRLRRAGLDYNEFASVIHHDDYQAFENCVGEQNSRVFALSTKGTANYTDTQFTTDDVFLFGPETRGLPTNILDAMPSSNVLRMPMVPDSRSLNLSNTAAIMVYEAWRQLDFAGGQ